MRNIYDYTRSELIDQCASWGFSRYHAEQIWRGIYREGAASLDNIPNLRSNLRQELLAHTHQTIPAVSRQQQSNDGYTRKFLLSLVEDGNAIETVIMRFHARRDRPEETNRYTACISTQAGCAMGCVFCATGQMGFTRHLTAAEIVGQVIFVQRELAKHGDSLRNIVLMGMGEPLHNYDNTMRAIDIITDHLGISLAHKHITLSTVGLPNGIRRLADDGLPINLAVSLHGATDEERQALVPPAKRWPLSELIDACKYYTHTRGRRIFFEWTLIAHENDTPEQAHALGRLLQGMAAHINVIPLNPTGGYAGRPSDPERVSHFQAILAQYGLPSTVRQRRGIDIAAGCGQLASAG